MEDRGEELLKLQGEGMCLCPVPLGLTSSEYLPVKSY